MGSHAVGWSTLLYPLYLNELVPTLSDAVAHEQEPYFPEKPINYYAVPESQLCTYGPSNLTSLDINMD